MSEVKVDINLLKKLRDSTGVSYADCRNALVEANNDFDKALEVLKIKGLSKAMKKTANETSEGIAKILVEGNKAVIAELSCQTDFVASNLEFVNLLNQILVIILKNNNVKSVQEVLDLVTENNETVHQLILKSINKLGENITLKRFEILTKNDNDSFGQYVHMGGSKAGLVVVNTNNKELATDLAMQLVAMNPKFISVEEIDQKVRDQELAIAKEQVKDVNKPAEIIEKMIQGKINKALAELTIVNQTFIKDQSINVNQLLKQNNAIIKNMVRYEIGEN